MKNLIQKIKNDKIINDILKFTAKTEEIYLVGGAIRDYKLGLKNTDKDIIINSQDAKTYALNLAQNLDASYVPLDEENEIYRIVLKDKINFIDIAAMIGNDIYEDLSRRDFTINAIACDLKKSELIDPFNGLNDLNLKTIKSISEQNFIDDPLRLLRAFRFQATLGFDFEENLQDVISKHSEKLSSCSIERINYETLKLFAGKFTVKSLFNMDKTGILKLIFPIIEELKKIPENSHHHLNLFYHSIETVNQIQNIYETSSKEIKTHLEKVDFGGHNRLSHLKLSAFLHDIGKPETWTIEEDTGRHRFIKHDDCGAKLCTKILKTNKFSKKQIKYISKMIKYHIYPSNVIAAPDINEKIYMRLIRKMEEDTIDIIILAMADRFSARGPEITDEIIRANIFGLQQLLDYYLNIRDSLVPIPKLLSGNEAMEILKIEPSKHLGIILKELHEAQLSGNVSSKTEAIAFIKACSIAKHDL